MDRIDRHVAWSSISARKFTSRSEDIWRGEPPEMAPELVLESLGQAGGWLITLSSAGAKRGLLVSLGEARFGGPVRPGDVLELEGHLDSSSEEAAVLSGRVVAGGRTVLEADGMMCVLVEAGTLEDPDRTEARRRLLMGERG